MQDSTLPYWFGVELELALTFREYDELVKLFGAFEGKKIHDQNNRVMLNPHTLIGLITQVLEDEGLPVSPFNNKRSSERWVVTEDGSITSDYSVEIVSPKFGDLNSCYSQIGTVFSALDKRYHILSEMSAATHVHVSIKDQSFSLSDVQLLAKGALYLSQPLCKLVVRNDNWSAANLDNKLSLTGLIKRIDGETDWKCIVDLACNSRSHAFNLRRLVDSKFQESERTIEVRRMHGSTKRRDAMHWIVMAISMVHLMLEKKIEAIPKHKDFKKKVMQAAVSLDIERWLDMREYLRSVSA